MGGRQEKYLRGRLLSVPGIFAAARFAASGLGILAPKAEGAMVDLPEYP